MANQKISALTALAGTDVEQLADVLPIVDTSVTTTKKILVSELSQAMLVLGTEQASTSGTSIDFTIPAWAKRVDVMLVGVSTNGTSSPLVQIGDSGGIENSGYLGCGTNFVSAGPAINITNYTAGFGIQSGSASAVIHGVITLRLERASTFMWVCEGNLSRSDSDVSMITSGRKALSAALTTVRITTVNGTDAFDAGVINILYE